MEQKPVNTIQGHNNTIKVNDLSSKIKLIIKDGNDETVSLENKIEYFYLYKDNKKFFPVDDIEFTQDGLLFRIPPLRRGLYKIEIKDTDGHIYPAGDDVHVLLKTSFDGGKEVEYTTMKKEVINTVEPIIINHIEENPEKFKGDKGDRGEQGIQGLKGEQGVQGLKGNKGDKGEKGIKGPKGDKGDTGPQGAKGDKGDTGPQGVKGDKGDKGDTGPAGEDGADGKDGQDVDYSVIFQTETIQVYIPTDFNTLQEAINFYKLKNTGLNVNIELIIESEHIINQGIYLENGDYSNFIIKSVDDIVKCDVTGKFMEGWRVNMPTLSCLIDMQNKGGDGIYASQNSNGYIEQRNGIINAGDRGIYITQGSSYSMYNTNFYGANSRALHVTNASIVEASFGDYSNSGNRSVYCSRGSKLNLQGANVENSGETAVYAIRSEINAQDVNVSGATQYGFYCSSGATIIAPSSIANDCLDAVYVSGSSRFSGDNIKINNTGNIAVRVSNGSMCDITFSTIENSISHGLYSENGSIINANRSVILNSGSSGVWSRAGSTVNVMNAEVKGSNVRALSVAFGGHIYAESLVTDNDVFDSSDTNISDLNTIFKEGIIFG